MQPTLIPENLKAARKAMGITKGAENLNKNQIDLLLAYYRGLKEIVDK